LACVGNGVSLKGILSEVARQVEYLHFPADHRGETLADFGVLLISEKEVD
jgi:hypothetical protein